LTALRPRAVVKIAIIVTTGPAVGTILGTISPWGRFRDPAWGPFGDDFPAPAFHEQAAPASPIRRNRGLWVVRVQHGHVLHHRGWGLRRHRSSAYRNSIHSGSPGDPTTGPV